ncbi:MAG: DUF2442 domain-containing protein [Saprospiraceae bacterium]|nr:DUF2442 domain-containing protein [Saprospiraceae bacterium]MDZ4703175.1 DUF2442 domain-containing protein [Saprospiraceae bacterium]
MTEKYAEIRLNLKENGISTLGENQNIRATGLSFDKDFFYLELEDRRRIGVPYNWFWRLAKATQEQRMNWHFIEKGSGIH